MVEKWVKISNLIFSNRVVEGSRSNNLTKVIMEEMMIGGRLARDHIVDKIISFGADGVNVFQGTKIGFIEQIHD